jgi:CheY-like chemotaxis protein
MISEVTEAHSFTSGCQAIEKNNYSLVLLDISLPTYDKIGVESGGKFRPFGGREIARKLARSSSTSKVLFITQYNSFSDRGASESLQSLEQLLKAECGDNYCGLIFYDSSKSAWRTEINNIFKMI